MKIVCDSNLLKDGISRVHSVAQTKISNPIVETILVKAENGILEFMGTDLSIDVKYWGSADVEEEGEIAIPSKIAQDLVRELYDEKTEVETIGKGVRLRCGSGSFNLQTLDIADFPRFKPLEEGKEITLDVEVLREAFRRTVFATTIEESRFELDGVKIDVKQDKLVFVASDGRRLSRVSIEGVDLGFRGGVVPTRTVEEIMRVLPASGEIRVLMDERKIMVAGDNFMLVGGLLRDKFPPYEQIIPKEFNFIVELDNEKFLYGVRSATVMARERGQMIKLSFENGRVTFYGEHGDTGAAKYACDAEYEGEPFEVAFRSMFLLDYLKVCGGGKTKLHIIDQERASIFIPEEVDNFLHLIMPMKIEDTKVSSNEED